MFLILIIYKTLFESHFQFLQSQHSFVHVHIIITVTVYYSLRQNKTKIEIRRDSFGRDHLKTRFGNFVEGGPEG